MTTGRIVEMLRIDIRALSRSRRHPCWLPWRHPAGRPARRPGWSLCPQVVTPVARPTAESFRLERGTWNGQTMDDLKATDDRALRDGFALDSAQTSGRA
eukprot:gene13362-biopygen4404